MGIFDYCHLRVVTVFCAMVNRTTGRLLNLIFMKALTPGMKSGGLDLGFQVPF